MKHSKTGLPWFLKLFVQLLSRQEDHEQYLGDVEELYFFHKNKKGKFAANLYILFQLLRSAPYFIYSSFFGGITMLNNHLKISFRNIFKHKLNSSINIIGMAIGLSVCFLILILVQDELSYDQFHEKNERIYKLLINDKPWISPNEAKLFKDKFPEIEEAGRFLPRNGAQVRYGENRFIETKFAYVDTALFKTLSFTFLMGNKNNSLSNSGNVIITEKMVLKYFGNKNPIGEIISVNDEDLYVSAVIESIPHNSHFHLDILIPLIDDVKLFGEEWANNWGWQNFHTYFLLKENVNKNNLAIKISDFVNNWANLKGTEHEIRYDLINIADIHLYSVFPEEEYESQSSINYVIIFSSIAIFILLIACFNYINILTANASVRLKEVSVKKVIGATKSQLIQQFLFEAILQFSISITLALAIMFITLPIFNDFTSKNLVLSNLLTLESFLSIVIILIVTIFIAGAYPARLLSSFSPTLAIKGISGTGNFSFNLRKVLLVVQYTVSIVLIISSLVILRQINYVHSTELGYDKDQIVICEFSDDQKNPKYPILKDILLQNKNIKFVSAGSRLPSTDLGNKSNIKSEGAEDDVLMGIVHTDFDFFETFDIKPIAGRLFSKKMGTDSEDAVILNESAVKALGLGHDPIGKRVSDSWQGADNYLNVIGIVPDFHFESLYNKITPVAFVIDQTECWQLVAKVNQNNVNETLSFVKNSWENFYPNGVYHYSFLDENYTALYDRDQKIFKLMIYFSILAVFIASMGLFGIITHSAKSRIKEIGIRKVLGASVSSIIKNLTVEYLMWVAISFCIAVPLVTYFLNEWLQNYAYRVNISFLDFMFAGIIIVTISFMTVIWQSVKAAKTNPVDSLKYQ